MKWLNRYFSRLFNAYLVLTSGSSVSAYSYFALFTIMACAGISYQAQAAFKDPLNTPARMVEAPEKRPLQAITNAGERLVAVGARGLIITSDDNGESWEQSPSPVQNDLLAVQFPTATQGWVVGHGGVVLHSADAGKSWQKQLDGRLAAEEFKAFYKSRAEKGDAASLDGLKMVELNYSSGPTLPLLDVWFDSAEFGFAVGSFGTILGTTDGGRSWRPWFERIDNEEQLNLNAIRGVGDDIYIAAERGTLFKFDRKTERFERVETGYEGSFFGLTGSHDLLVAYGLSGMVYRSLDAGEIWENIVSPSGATITSGVILPGSQEMILVNAGGDLLWGNGATDEKLSLRKSHNAARYTDIVLLPNDQLLFITSMEGVRIESLHDALRTGNPL